MLPISKAKNSNSNSNSKRNKLMEYGIVILFTLGIRYLLFDTITISSSNSDEITKTMKTTKTTSNANANANTNGNGNGNGNSNGNANTSTNNNTDDDNNNFEFVVVLGLEGTGHHLYTALIDQSPYFKLYQNLVMSQSKNNSNSKISPQSLLNELRHSLFDGTKSKTNIGLINAPCTERRVPVLKNKANKKKAKNNKAKKSSSSSRRTRQQSSRKLNVEESYYDPNSQEIFNRVVNALKDIKQLVIENNNSENNSNNSNNSNNVNMNVNVNVNVNVNENENENVNVNVNVNVNENVNVNVNVNEHEIENVNENENENEIENNNNENNNQDDELKKLKSKIKLRIPINGGFGDTPRYGMLSYPNWKDLQQKQNSQDQQSQQKLQSCRSYQHLSLDLLYHACHQANVRCKHLYIYRNPIDILISTVYKRNFHGSHGYLFASRLYITMLEVLESQLTHNFKNSLGCINFYEDENGNDWKTLIRDVWGWSSSSNYSTSTSTNNDYERIIEKTYKKKESISSSPLVFKNSKKHTNNSTTTTTTTDININNNDNDNSKMINELNTFIQNNKPYLDLFYTAHQRTIHAGCMS